MQETWVRSLEWEDLLEKGMAMYSSILAWRIPRTREPGEESDMTEGLTQMKHLTEGLTEVLHTLLHTILSTALRAKGAVNNVHILQVKNLRA